MADPINVHLGVANILNGVSGLVANTTVHNTASGDQPFVFDVNTAGSNVPAGVSVNAANGEITLPAGVWIICGSALVRSDITGGRQNSRGYYSIGIRHGANYRHISPWSYSRWGSDRPAESTSLSWATATNLPAELRLPWKTLTMSIAGAVITTPANPRITLRCLWSQQIGGSTTFLHAHLHAVQVLGAMTAAELRTLLASLGTLDTITDDTGIVLFDDDGVYKSDISELPTGGGSSEPTEHKLQLFLITLQHLLIRNQVLLFRLINSAGNLRKTLIEVIYSKKWIYY